MPTRSDVAALLADMAPVISRLGGRWCLFGAQAVVLHGRPRLTEDVDITLEIDRRRVLELVDGLVRAGFLLRVAEDPEAFVAATSVLPLRHAATHLDLDIVLAGSGLEADFLDRAEVIDLDGVSVPVISPSDLIVTKLLAGRPLDLEDVHSVVQLQRPRLDPEKIRRTLVQLEEALSVSDLLPVFEEIWTRRSGRRRSS